MAEADFSGIILGYLKLNINSRNLSEAKHLFQSTKFKLKQFQHPHLSVRVLFLSKQLCSFHASSWKIGHLFWDDSVFAYI